MSLINELLTDLENRRGGHRDQQTLFADLTPVTDDFDSDYRRRSGAGAVSLLLIVFAIAGGGYLWLGPAGAGDDSAGAVRDQIAVADDTLPEPVVYAIEPEESEAELLMVAELPEARAVAAENRMPLQLETSLSTPVAAAPDIAESDIVQQDETPEVKPDVAGSALKQVRVDDAGDTIRLKLNLSGQPEHRSYLLADPYRMVVEFDQTAYEVNGNPAADSRHIKQVRNGEHESALKVVFDLNGPMELVDTQYVSDAGSSQLLLSLLPHSNESVDVQPEVVADIDGVESPEVIHNRQMHKRPRSGASASSDQDDYERGLRHYNRSEFRQSIVAFNTAVGKNPQHARAHYLLVSALLQLNERAAAEAQLEQALGDIPENADLRRLYAHLLIDRGDLNGALSILQQSMPALADEPEYHALMAAVYQELDDHARAVQVYRQLVEIAPANSVWWMGMGISLEALARPDEALASYRKALDGGALAADLRQFVSNRILSLTQEQSS